MRWKAQPGSCASMLDNIEKTIVLKAPVARVWRALTDAEEFGIWFRVKLEGPFVAGAESRGHITYPGYEHLRFRATVVRIEAPLVFAFTWHPYAIDPDRDYDDEPATLVTFRLEPTSEGTRLTVTESGFDALPPERRDLAFRMNERGWGIQMENIASHVA
jgi:uncharacterized protein YndB with AHSA1/START domain